MFFVAVLKEEMDELREEAALIRSVMSDPNATPREIALARKTLQLRSELISALNKQSIYALSDHFCVGGMH